MVIALALYSLTILVRNILVGLDGVDPEVRDAAAGMGLSPWRTLWRVEAPLALPSAMAGCGWPRSPRWRSPPSAR